MRSAMVAAVACAASLSACAARSSAGNDLQEAMRLDGGWQRVTRGEAVALPSDPLGDARHAEVEPGKPLLINFWASTCVGCAEEVPYLNKAAARDDVEVIGVTLDRFDRYAHEFVADHDVTYPNWSDPDLDYMQRFMDVVGVSLPSTVLLMDGRVVAVHLGPFDSSADLSRTNLAKFGNSPD